MPKPCDRPALPPDPGRTPSGGTTTSPVLFTSSRAFEPTPCRPHGRSAMNAGNDIQARTEAGSAAAALASSGRETRAVTAVTSSKAMM